MDDFCEAPNAMAVIGLSNAAAYFQNSCLVFCLMIPLPLVLFTYVIFKLYAGDKKNAVQSRAMHDLLTTIRELEVLNGEHCSELSRMKLQVEELAEVRQQLKANDKEQQERILCMEKQLAEKIETLKSTEARLVQLRSLLHNSEMERDRLKEELAVVDERVQASRESIDDLEAQLEKLKAENRSLFKQLSEACEANQLKPTKEDSSQTDSKKEDVVDVTRLRVDMHKLDKEVEQARADLCKAKDELTHLRKELELKEGELCEKKDKLDEYKDFVQMYNESQAEHKRKDEEKHALDQENKQLLKELDESKCKAVHLESTLSSLQQANATLKGEIVKLEQEKLKLDNDNLQLIDQLRDALHEKEILEQAVQKAVVSVEDEENVEAPREPVHSVRPLWNPPEDICDDSFVAPEEAANESGSESVRHRKVLKLGERPTAIPSPVNSTRREPRKELRFDDSWA
ncbi:hypothetical protein QR680_007569 [Steinernema hermaphroditum]|uniref:Uncharacterized protein n=1 Tax=Steinernema hermaphroditum TaxID=289476 RepID=A0AA39M5K5_9BILA|nr:hypothetical protein QR680_007569 [Steinernema hermaphroditum]